MKDYEIVVGLEVHAELSTKTKIYCGCENKFGAEVNKNCCPICTGMPGTLPSLNKEVVHYAVKAGLAMNCDINKASKQDRKNYFYPDLPKAYQISQFDIPLCEHGYVDFFVDGEEKRVGVTRIHIEEDAGKFLHDTKLGVSLVDFNRCGVPLIEIVSEPDMRSSKEAKEYLEAVKLILQHIDVSDCKMQEGSIRCDINVSVRERGAAEFGTRCEMKNVNTFTGAVRAIEYEAARQIKIIEEGGEISQETRRWDDMKGENFLLRSKEDAHDYRYFPEPDVAPILLSEEYIENIRKEIPALPFQKTKRYLSEYQLSMDDAALLAATPEKGEFFELCVKESKNPRLSCNFVLGEVSRVINETGKGIFEIGIAPKEIAEIISLIDEGKISMTVAKTVFDLVLKEKKSPIEIVKEKGLLQINDEGEMERLVDEILSANLKSIEDYKNGKTNAMGFLVGQCMRASKGKGNPKILTELLTKKLNG